MLLTSAAALAIATGPTAMGGAASAPPGVWPQFRGPNASGVADGQDAPLAWNAESGENLRFKVAIPGLGHSSPVVWGDRVFVTTAVSEDQQAVLRHRAGRPYEIRGDVESLPAEPAHSFRVYCMDRESGAVRWQREARLAVPAERRHPKATHANATPVTDGRTVVAWFGAEGLYAYSVEGTLLWQQHPQVPPSAFARSGDEWGAASSPVLHDGRVVVVADGVGDSFVAAYALENGEEVWRTSRDEITSWATPALVAGPRGEELVVNGGNAIRGYDPRSGAELWALRGNSMIAVPTPVVGDGLVYVTSGYVIPGIRPIYAIRPGGRGDISLAPDQRSNAHVAWSWERDGVYVPSQLLYRGVLYSLDDNGTFIAYDAATGEQIYKVRAERGSVYSASPIAADGHLYLTSEGGDVHVVKAGREYELVRSNPMGEVCMATPAISRGMLFLRCRSHLYGIGSGREPQDRERVSGSARPAGGTEERSSP